MEHLQTVISTPAEADESCEHLSGMHERVRERE